VRINSNCKPFVTVLNMKTLLHARSILVVSISGLLEITFSGNVSKMSSIFQGTCKFPENIREYIQSLSESRNVYIP